MANDDWFLQFLYDHNPFNYDWNNRGKPSRGHINTALDLVATPEDKNKWKYDAARIPFIGDYYRWQDQSNYWKDYMDPRGLTWADAKYPTMMMGAGTAGNAVTHGVDTMMSMSKTLGRLYEGLNQDQGDWTPAVHPRKPVRTNVGIRNGGFYHFGY